MEAVNGVSEGDKGGPPPPSPLTGCYLLIVIGEPHCNEHKDIILQRVAKGLLSWDVNGCLVDLEKELSVITEMALEGEEARYGERLIQFASENLVTEILIHPVVSTLAQCVRNLLSSFTRHRHIIHAGYTFANNGSWVLQDGTFSLTDFCEAFQEIEVLRVIRAYENGISVDIHCSPEGDWTRLPKEPFTKGCKVRVNPNDVLTAGSPSITSFVNYLEPFLIPAELEAVLESSDVVGNIRFSRPTLYVFPGGQGDAALFGINGFNMLLDGGFSRKACFWDFVRHLDRLDAVLLTRLNNSNVCGISSILKRKRQNALYPQIGHFFCNIQERKAILSPDGDKDKDPLLINLLDEGQEIVSNLRHLSLNPQVCYRDSEPINLYHKVGHGTLDMYVLSPAKDSKEVREFLQKWNNNDQKLFANPKTKDFVFPLQNLVSICALLVWQPANPEDTITRILFPGSSPQNKIFEGLDKIKSLDFIKHPVCSEKSLAPATIIKAKQSVIDRIIPAEKKILDNKKEKPQKPADPIIDTEIKNGEVNGVQTEKSAPVKKSDSTESEKSVSKPKKIIENGDNVDKVEKAKPKPKSEPKTKPRSESQPRKADKKIEKKPSPTTPKKQIPKSGEEPKPKPKPSPTSTPAKSAKEANNRKVLESKKSAPVAKKEPAKPPVEKKEVKTERKPISRRPKDASKAAASPTKKVNGVQKPDSISRRGKLDKEGTTDSSTVSTPSAEQDSILKKDISKLTPDEIQKLKAQELADLKEEQEAVKEIEAVFRKGELQADKSSDFRKVKDISIDDKLESEEYLIIEKTEIVQDLANEPNKEEETQKIARDSEESEKLKKPSDEKLEVEEKREETEDELPKIITSATDAVKSKEEAVEVSKEPSVTSPEEKVDVSSKKEEEVKEVAQESQPDEKGSGNIESGATTTAPTLPEDERMPLDEIKEDNGDQVIEEKHVKEDTKEKEVPVIQLPPKTVENIAKLPPVVGIRLDKQAHMRDIVKTPDEVADLPVHEEVEFDHYEEYHATEIKAEAEEAKKEETGKTDDKVVEDKAETKKAEEKDKAVDKVVQDKAETKEAEETNKALDVTVEKEKTEVGVKDVETKDSKAVPEVAKEDTAVISEDLNKKELSKSPDEEKDTDEHELEEKKNKESDIKEKASTESKEPKEEETKKEAVEPENIAKKEITDDKLEEQQKKTQPKEVKEAKITAETKVSEKTEKSIEKVEPQTASKEAEKLDSEVKEKEDVKPKEDKKLEELKEKLPEAPKDEVKPIQTEAKDIEMPSLESDMEKIQQIDEKLQKLNEKSAEVKDEKKENTEVATKEESKPKEDATEKIDERLQKLKDDDTIKGVSEVITHKVEEPQHAESVIITADSLPESPCVDEKKIDDKLELGRKSPKEREEDVAKIVASVAEVLKSDAPLEEFEGKIPFSIPYTTYTTELRETHITTVGSPVASETKGVKESFCPKTSSTFLIEEERKIAPIHEEPEQESRINRMIEDSNELIQATSKIIQDIKQPQIEKIDEEPGKEEQDSDVGTVHRMLVTASSEDGGEEIEICPPGTITFSRSSESSGRSSPDPQSQKLSQKSSISDATVINKKDSDKHEAKDIKEPVIDSVCDTAKLDKKDESEATDCKHKEETIKPEDKKDATQALEDKKDVEKSSQDATAKTEEKKAVEETVTEKLVEKESASLVESKAEKQKQEEKKYSVGELQEKLVNETDAAIKEVEETMKNVEEKVDAKVEDVTKQVEKERSILSGVVNDIGTSLLEDTTKLIEDAQKHVQEIKDGAKGKIEDLKKDMITDKEKYDKAAGHIEEKIKKEASAVSETVGKVEESVKEELIKEQNTLIDSATEIENSIVEKAQTVTEQAKIETEKVKETVKEKVSEIQETITKQEETIVGTVSDTSQTLTKDIESKTSDIRKVVQETKEKAKIEIEETLKSVNEKVEEKITSLEKSVTDSTDESKQIVEESKKLLEDTKEKISEKASSEMKVIEEKTKDMLEGIKSQEEILKKSVVEELIYLEEKLDEDKHKVVEKFETFTKDLEKTEVPTEEKEKDEKYNLFNGLESVEKMVVDVITADREDAQPKEENKKDTNGILEKVESEVEEIVEKGVEEVKELVHDAKEAITHLFKHEPSKEEVLEQVAEDVKENYEAVTDMAKSVVFEKCEKSKEEHKQLEKQLETSVQNLEKEYEKVSDMAAFVVFDKCEKPLTEEEKETKKEKEQEEQKKETKEEKKEETKEEREEEKQWEKSAKGLEEEFEKVAKMAKSMSFEKCEKVSEVEKEEKTLEKKEEKQEEKKEEKKEEKNEEKKEEKKEEKAEEKEKEKQWEKSAKDLEEEFEKVTKMAKSMSFEKCEKAGEVEKEEKALEKSAQNLEKEFEAVSNMAKSIHFDKCEKSSSELEKEKQFENLDKASEKEQDIVNDMSKSSVFKKCETPSEKQKEEKALESSAKSIQKDYEVMTDMSKSTVFEECEKPPTKEQKKEKIPEKTAQDKENETVSKKAESVSFEKCDALKDELKETKESASSPPKSPKTLESKDEDPSKLSGKSSPEPSSIKNLSKEDSGKSTPETKEMDHMKVDNQDSLLSGKSSPGLSGKSSPILSEASLGANAESKDSLLSGKSTPEPGKVESLSGKSSPALSDKAKPDEKEQLESEKTSPKLSIKDKETEKETKSDVKTVEKEVEKVEANANLNKEKKTEIEKEVIQTAEPLKKAETEKVDDTKPTSEQSPTKAEEKPLEASASDLSKSESAETKDISLDSGIDTEVEPKKKVEEKKEAKTEKQGSAPGTSLTQETVTSLKTSTEDLHLSGKSTPDIAEVEKQRELQDIKQEKHILGSSTPPTVPVSPVVKEKPEEKPASTPIKSAITSVKDSDVRSCTPGSDDYEVGASTHSDISSGQASRAPPVLEGERIESDEDDDVPGSPMSVTSQVAHSRSSSRYDFDDERIGTKLDPMNTSFYGALPDEETDLDFEKALTEHRQTRGEDLVYEESPSYLYEVTKAKYSRTPEPENLDQINKNGAGNVMTASFMGDLPTSSATSEKKDAFDAWGKPLGLPSPAPPNDNKGTPKKERKLPPNVSAKNKLNDDKKRSESPSKFRNKKYNPVYVDLTYVPHHGNAHYSYVDFFKRVRARYYVFSGIEPSRDVYNALLEAKQTWEDKELEVTIIPTYDTDILGYWVAENEELLSKYKIDLSPSASRCTINLQDHETSCSAYRLEF